MSTQSKTWESAGYRNLYRHKSGAYYVRISSGSKPSWKTLRTKSKEIAIRRAEEMRKELLAASETESSHQLGANAKMEQLIAIRLEQIENDTALKPRTVDYYKEVFGVLSKHWKGLESLTVKSIKPIDCQRWAKKCSEHYSPTRYNNALGGYAQALRNRHCRRNQIHRPNKRHQTPAPKPERSFISPAQQ